MLLPLLLVRAQAAVLVRHGRELLVLGLTQSALPFVLFSFAAPRISTGLAAILGATTPLFAATIARAWTGERLAGRRTAGLWIGFGGVVVLVAQRSGLEIGRAHV